MDRPTALVIEDDPGSSRLVGEILRKSGVEASFVTDRIDALVSLHESIPDLVILDIALPRVNGWQVLRALRMGDLASAVPIIVITAHGQGTSARRALDAGRTASSRSHSCRPRWHRRSRISSRAESPRRPLLRPGGQRILRPGTHMRTR